MGEYRLFGFEVFGLPVISSKELVGLGVQGKPWGEIGDTEKKLSKKPSSSAFVEMEASQPTGPLSDCSGAAVFIFL